MEEDTGNLFRKADKQQGNEQSPYTYCYQRCTIALLDAIHLARTIVLPDGCPRQIVAYSDRVFGFQCHMELTLDVVERLIAHSEKDLSRAAEYRFVDTPEALRAHDYTNLLI